MINKDEYSKTTELMSQAIDAFSEHISTIRAGRANPSVLNNIYVDYYGQKTPLNQIGNVSSPEPRLLVIQPWDSTIIKMIEKAILASDLGINPQNDGRVIRLVFPVLSQERRNDLVKKVKAYGEEAKVKIRNIRRDDIEKYKKQKKDSIITEDDYAIIEKDIQNLTDTNITKIDDIVKSKTDEIMEV
ncbi:MAG: Ribosome-recycling factor [Firmicutes bacterium ADurb.Bin146]|jgi:ribosome recycling factor|nr:MAG: Ribosome-recycling factor [Firmicutes bacterium ADurb.Bin146]